MCFTENKEIYICIKETKYGPIYGIKNKKIKKGTKFQRISAVEFDSGYSLGKENYWKAKKIMFLCSLEKYDGKYIKVLTPIDDKCFKKINKEK